MFQRVFILFVCFSLYLSLLHQANAHPDAGAAGPDVVDATTHTLDANLEAVIRAKINKSTGNITVANLRDR